MIILSYVTARIKDDDSYAMGSNSVYTYIFFDKKKHFVKKLIVFFKYKAKMMMKGVKIRKRGWRNI